MRITKLLLPLLATASVAGAQSYAPSTDYPASCHPFDIEWCDVDGDGLLDMLSIGAFPTTGILTAVEFRRANANGTFQPPITFVPNGAIIQDIECLDADGDGDPDLLITSPFAGFSQPTLQIVPNDYATSPTMPFAGSLLLLQSPPNIPYGAVVFDADFDPFPDFAVTDTAAGTLAIYLHGGSAPGYLSSPSVINIGGAPGEIVATDLDGDGVVDFVITNDVGTSRSLTVVRSEGVGPACVPTSLCYLTTTITLPSAASPNPKSQVACVDVNGDGLIDVVATHPAGVTYALLNPPTGPNTPFTFQAPTDVAGLTGTSYSALDAADADGDGDLDLFTAQAFGTTVEILTLAGGSFTSTTSLAAPSFVADLETVDRDGDGDLDFAVSTITSIPAGPCGVSLFDAVRYPGTPDTLILSTSVLPSFPTPTSGPFQDVKPITNGQTLQVQVSDPAAVFPTALLYVVGNPTGTPLTQPFPGVWLTAPPAVLLSSGPLPGTYAQAIPASPNLLGTSLWFQAYSISASAANGSYAATDVHELRFF